VDGHRFYANPDPTFRFDVDSDPDPDPISRYTQVGKSLFNFFSFYSRQCQFTLCIIRLISITVIGVKIFRNLDSILKLSGKLFSLSFYSVKMDTDPDRKALDTDPEPAK
jgi:hypothetical protein